jgi:hypothetical protein
MHIAEHLDFLSIGARATVLKREDDIGISNSSVFRRAMAHQLHHWIAGPRAFGMPTATTRDGFSLIDDAAGFEVGIPRVEPAVVAAESAAFYRNAVASAVLALHGIAPHCLSIRSTPNNRGQTLIGPC